MARSKKERQRRLARAAGADPSCLATTISSATNRTSAAPSSRQIRCRLVLAQCSQSSRQVADAVADAGRSATRSRQTPGSSGLGRRSIMFLVNSEWRRTVIFSISCRARTQVSTVDLMAPSSSEASAVSRARSAAMAGASAGASLPGGRPELLDLGLDGRQLRAQRLGGVERIRKGSPRHRRAARRAPPRARPDAGSSFPRLSIAPVSRVMLAATSLGRVAASLGVAGLLAPRPAVLGGSAARAAPAPVRRAGSERPRSQPGARRGGLRR